MDVQHVDVVGAQLLEGTVDGSAEGFFVVSGVVDVDVAVGFNGRGVFCCDDHLFYGDDEV